jgi:hypothetical protein
MSEADQNDLMNELDNMIHEYDYEEGDAEIDL